MNIATCIPIRICQKKPSVNRAAKLLQPKNHFLSDLLKIQRGDPSEPKKNFVSDFDVI